MLDDKRSLSFLQVDSFQGFCIDDILIRKTIIAIAGSFV